jgi:hypothetical protein
MVLTNLNESLRVRFIFMHWQIINKWNDIEYSINDKHLKRFTSETTDSQFSCRTDNIFSDEIDYYKSVNVL